MCKGRLERRVIRIIFVIASQNEKYSIGYADMFCNGANSKTCGNRHGQIETVFFLFI